MFGDRPVRWCFALGGKILPGAGEVGQADAGAPADAGVGEILNIIGVDLAGQVVSGRVFHGNLSWASVQEACVMRELWWARRPCGLKNPPRVAALVPEVVPNAYCVSAE